MASVSPVKFSTGGKNLGTFKCETFNLFDEEQRQAYADLRNLAADMSSGIKIELVREYSTKRTETETMEGGSSVTRTFDEIIIVIHFWEKKAAGTKGRSKAEQDDDNKALTK